MSAKQSDSVQDSTSMAEYNAIGRGEVPVIPCTAASIASQPMQVGVKHNVRLLYLPQTPIEKMRYRIADENESKAESKIFARVVRKARRKDRTNSPILDFSVLFIGPESG